MAWAKLHTDILGDPKLMRAARKGAKGLHLLPWIIAFAKQADDEGRLTVGGQPAEAADIAQTIPGIPPRMVTQCLASLEQIGVLENDDVSGALRLTAWERRSGTKPSDNPDAIRTRVKAHRTRKALQDNEHETPRNAFQGDDCNATEKRREEESRTEKEKKPRTSPKAATGWIAPFADRWRERYGGDMPIGPALRPLSGLLTNPDERPEVLRRWGNYLAATEGQYASATKFASTYGQWSSAQPPNGNRPGIANRVFAKGMDALRDEP